MTTDKRLQKKSSLFQPLKLAIQVGLICGLAVTGISDSFAGPREQAKRMHDRLAGIPPTEEMLCAMETLIAANNAEGAAQLVMTIDPIQDSTLLTACDQQANVGNNNGRIDNDLSKKAFYSVTVKNMVTPWTNEDMTMNADLNDFSALVIGMVRDNVPFDTVLSADLLYKGADSLNLTNGLSPSNNEHFKELQDEAHDLSDPINGLVATTQTGEGYLPASPTDSQDVARPAGVVTTRAASLAFFTGGTNRLMFRSTLMNFMCRDLEQIKDVSRVNDRIRQDVSRSPGGDSSIFLSACMGCHAGMDPMVGAYAYYDHELTADDDPNPNAPTGRMFWKQNSSMFDGVVSTAGQGESLFNQNCAACHGQTDKAGRNRTQIVNAINNDVGGMGIPSLQALDSEIDAIVQFLAGNDTPAPVTVTQKYLINAGNFKYGYITKDDQWTNYWREGPNTALEWGWRESLGYPRSIAVTLPDGSTRNWTVPDNDATISASYGAASLGYEITSTKAFAQCQVEQVYKFVCLHDPIEGHAQDISDIVNAFPPNYNMKNVFAKVAPLCMGN